MVNHFKRTFIEFFHVMIPTLSTSSSLDSPSHPHVQSHRRKAASVQPHPTGACLPELLQHGGGLERLFAMPLAQTREPLGHAHYEELEPFCAAPGAITWSVSQAFLKMFCTLQCR